MSYRIFSSILFSLIGAAVAFGQGHSIRGKVRNAQGINLPRITVNLESGNGGMVNQTVTNNEGDFSFVGLSDTSYLITIAAPDYDPTSERVEFVRNISPDDPGEIRTVEITLVAKDFARPSRTGVKFVQNVPKAALDLFKQAKKLGSNQRSQDAQNSLKAAIELFPDYFDARFMLANELVKSGQLDEAIKQLNEAQRINPKDDRVWYIFGTVLMRQGKYAIAARVFAEAARLSPLDAEYPFMQGVSLINQAAITQTTSAQANEARTFYFAEAEKALLRSYDVSEKKLHIVHLQLARLYEKRGDRVRAASELEEYLKKTPDAKNAQAIRDAIKRLKAAR